MIYQTDTEFEPDIRRFLRKPLDFYIKKALEIKKDNYMLINLKGQSPERLHRLVWFCEHGPIPDDYEVHHISGNKWDNQIENLELIRCDEHAKKHLIGKIGKKRSAIARSNIAAGIKKSWTPERRVKYGAWRMGKIASESTKAKMRASQSKRRALEHDLSN